MKIKFTNTFFGKASEETALVKLCKCDQLPVKVSYWLSRLLKVLIPLNQTFLEERKKLIEKWCDRTEDGKVVVVKDIIQFTEHGREYNADIVDLFNIGIELDINKIIIPIDKIPVGLLNSYDFEELEAFIEFTEN